MGNLGAYQWITTVSKKVGGPVKLLVGIALGGYTVIRLGEAGIKKVIRTVKTHHEKSGEITANTSKVYEAAKTKAGALEQKRADRMARADAMDGFIFELAERDEVLTEFDDKLWIATIEKATAYHDGGLVFTFNNGMKIEGRK